MNRFEPDYALPPGWLLKDDHLWFSLFHEAAHLVLHSKKAVFVDGPDGGGEELEAEADSWAAGGVRNLAVRGTGVIAALRVAWRGTK